MFSKILNTIIKIEANAIVWKARNGLMLLRISLGIVFIWFGVLKFFPNLSSAEDIAGRTILKLSFGRIDPSFSMPFLAIWECLIGLGLLTKKFLPITLFFLYLQMAGALSPLFFFPELTFSNNIFAPTLLGQYIIKNIVLISAAIVIGATVEGGDIVSNDEVVEKDRYKQKVTLRFIRRFKRKPVPRKNN